MLDDLSSLIPSFSKSQRSIANYITEHYDKAAFMTAAKLGQTVGVSESTVVRFATELGYDGYPRLQKAMQEMIRSKLTSVQRIEISSSRFDEGNILKSVLNMDIDKIRHTLEETSRENFDGAVDALINAQKIYILGARSSAILAQFLGFYFHLLFDNVQIINTSSESEVYEQMLWLKKGDVLIDISFPRYSKRAVKALNYAASHGADVIAITDSNSSPIAKNSTFVLLAHSEMASFVDSLVAPLSLINALIVAITYKKRTEISDTFERLEGIWDEYQVYEKDVRNS